MKKQSEFKTPRITRLFSILGQLSPHSQVTVTDLSQSYQVCERTIQRDIQVLQLAKLGVYYDTNGTLKIHRQGYKTLHSWMLS